MKKKNSGPQNTIQSLPAREAILVKILFSKKSFLFPVLFHIIHIKNLKFQFIGIFLDQLHQQYDLTTCMKKNA